MENSCLVWEEPSKVIGLEKSTSAQTLWDWIVEAAYVSSWNPFFNGKYLRSPSCLSINPIYFSIAIASLPDNIVMNWINDFLIMIQLHMIWQCVSLNLMEFCFIYTLLVHCSWWGFCISLSHSPDCNSNTLFTACVFNTLEHDITIAKYALKQQLF